MHTFHIYFFFTFLLFNFYPLFILFFFYFSSHIHILFMHSFSLSCVLFYFKFYQSTFFFIFSVRREAEHFVPSKSLAIFLVIPVHSILFSYFTSYSGLFFLPILLIYFTFCFTSFYPSIFLPYSLFSCLLFLLGSVSREAEEAPLPRKKCILSNISILITLLLSIPPLCPLSQHPPSF